jgi:hypothetical protein
MLLFGWLNGFTSAGIVAVSIKFLILGEIPPTSFIVVLVGSWIATLFGILAQGIEEKSKKKT